MNVHVTAGKLADLKTEALALGFLEGDFELTGPKLEADQISGGLIAKVLASGDFKGKPNQTLVLYAADAPFKRLVLVGLGKDGELTLEKIRNAGGKASTTVRELGVKSIAVAVPGVEASRWNPSEGRFDMATAAQAVAEGVLLSLYPWEKVVTGGSPFVLIFHELNSNFVANVLNAVVLTAALSVYNSGVYCNSRMLYGLAGQGNAPRALLKVNARGIPLAALGVSAAATAVCVVINYFMPGKAFELLMGLVVSALIINWAMISVIHLAFRRAKARAGETTSFKSLGYPLTNYVCLAFLGGILVVMYLIPDLRISVYLIPVWLVVLGVGYRLRQKRGAAPVAVSATR